MSTPHPILPDHHVPEGAIVHLIAARLDTLQSSMQRMEGVQNDLAAGFTKLILIEERQARATESLERAFKSVERLDNKVEAYNEAAIQARAEIDRRVVSLEKAEPLQAQTSKWVLAAMWGSLGFLALYIAPRVLDKVFP